jgi:hypothetical protein
MRGSEQKPDKEFLRVANAVLEILGCTKDNAPFAPPTRQEIF